MRSNDDGEAEVRVVRPAVQVVVTGLGGQGLLTHLRAWERDEYGWSGQVWAPPRFGAPYTWRWVAAEKLSLNTVKRYARMAQPERLVRAPAYRPTLVDPYRDHLRRRRAADPAVAVTTLLAEIRALGYSGSANLLVRYINQGRLDSDRPPISARGLTGLILTRPEHLGYSQRQLRDELTTACPEMIDLADAVRDFADLLEPHPGNQKHLAEWITTVRAADLPYLHAFTRGLDKDAAAVAAGISLPYSNGPTEGHVNRIKMIKRQMYGRANLDLLRKRVLLAT